MSQQAPGLVTRGLHPPITTQDGIDWLSLTFPSKADVVYPDYWEQKTIKAKPLNGYNQAVSYRDGRIEMWHTDRADMGVHVIMSGKVIEQLAGIGVTELGVFSNAGASFRRFDVCRDVWNSNIKFTALASHIRKKKAITKARSFPTYSTDGANGKTQYVGKWTSDCYARIYDKAYEQKVSGNWIRVEVVYKDDKANPAVKAFLTGASVVSLLRAVIDFPAYGAWVDAITSDTVAGVSVGRKLGATKKWLLESCAPSLARQLFLDGSEDFLFDFNAKVKAVYDNLTELEAIRQSENQ